MDLKISTSIVLKATRLWKFDQSVIQFSHKEGTLFCENSSWSDFCGPLLSNVGLLSQMDPYLREVHHVPDTGLGTWGNTK